jgi:quercetin 2,3-dioxygenase
MNDMRTVNAIYRASYTDYEGLDTYRVMPTRNVPIDALDPFLFLNHHGPQRYPPQNAGLPFGPHPHKGFETVTLIIKGDLVHKDSTGYSSNIKAGGIQWMTAGRGIIHSETSSDLFRRQGGEVEILQLWVNLPARFKQVEPHYVGLQPPEVPEVEVQPGVTMHLVSGVWGTHKAPVQSLSDVHLCTIEFKREGNYSTSIASERTILFYVIQGDLTVNGQEAEVHDLVEFQNKGERLDIQGQAGTLLLLGHALPTREPIAAQGPFVMNSQEEIRQAFVDYQQGKFGVWGHDAED